MSFWKPKARQGSPQDRGRGRVLRFPQRANKPSDAPKGKLSALLHVGPGIVTGASDLDPSAVITATVIGAAYHYSLLWVVIFCVPFLLALFSVTGRIGVETKKGVLDLVRENYGRYWAIGLTVVTIVINMAVIIADMMAVSDAFSIVLRLPRSYFVAPIAFTVWYILIFRDYRKITKVLVIFSLPLYIFIASAFITAPPLHQLIHEIFVPRLGNKAGVMEAIVALFGSFLTPYIVLWQTSSRSDPEHEPHMADSYAATIVAAVLGISIIIAAGSVLDFAGPTDMTTRQAAEALRPVVGDLGSILFAIGIIGSGLVALPVLVASMCYSVAEAMGWPAGLSEHPWEAKSFYILISAALFVASVVNFFRINPVKALYFSQVLAGILTIPILAFILLLSNNRRVMQTINTRAQNFWMGAVIGALLAAGAWFLGSQLLG